MDNSVAAPPSERVFSRRLALGGLASAAGAAVVALRGGTATAQTGTTGPEGTVVATGTDATTATGSSTTAAATTTTTLPPQRPTTADTVLLGFAQTLELAAAQLYDPAISVLSKDLAATATAFRRHHQSYAEQLGALLGRRAPGVANATLLRERTAAFGAGSEPASLRAMYELESSLAASYATLLGDLKATDGAALIASILPIEARQAVVLGQAIGLPNDDLMPLLEGDENGATVFTPSQYPVLG